MALVKVVRLHDSKNYYSWVLTSFTMCFTQSSEIIGRNGEVKLSDQSLASFRPSVCRESACSFAVQTETASVGNVEGFSTKVILTEA